MLSTKNKKKLNWTNTLFFDCEFFSIWQFVDSFRRYYSYTGLRNAHTQPYTLRYNTHGIYTAWVIVCIENPSQAITQTALRWEFYENCTHMHSHRYTRAHSHGIWWPFGGKRKCIATEGDESWCWWYCMFLKFFFVSSHTDKRRLIWQRPKWIEKKIPRNAIRVASFATPIIMYNFV